VTTGQSENLTPHNGDVLYSVSDVSPDGRTLLIASNEKGGYSNVALLDVGSKKRTWVTDTKWEADAGEFSPDGKTFTYIVNGRPHQHLLGGS
jgi:Tol biopolymer transport system component